MADFRPRNFLLGYGERLTDPVRHNSGPPNKRLPYTVEQAAARLASQVSDAASDFDNLPELARPRDEVVAIATLHPNGPRSRTFRLTLFSPLG
jgi:hypothetical protein